MKLNTDDIIFCLSRPKPGRSEIFFNPESKEDSARLYGALVTLSVRDKNFLKLLHQVVYDASINGDEIREKLKVEIARSADSATESKMNS